MRVLIKQYGAIGVMEVDMVCYVEDLSDYPSIKATGEGLCMVSGGVPVGVPGINKEECEDIVMELYRLGNCDLTRYGDVV